MKHLILYSSITTLLIIIIFSGKIEVGITNIILLSLTIVFGICAIISTAALNISKYIKGLMVFMFIFLVGGTTTKIITSPNGTITLDNTGELYLKIDVIYDNGYDYYLTFENELEGEKKSYKLNVNQSLFEDLDNRFDIKNFNLEKPLRFNILQEDKVVFTGKVYETQDGSLYPKMYYKYF